MSTIVKRQLTWVEIDRRALTKNVQNFKKLASNGAILAPAVKANAYGHGTCESAKIILAAGANWLCVNSLFEAQILRKNGIASPIYIMGYTMEQDLAEAVNLDCRLIIYNKITVQKLSAAAQKQKKTAKIHLKIETGNNRQGILESEILDFVEFAQKLPNIEIEGMASHFANIEDLETERIMDTATGKIKTVHALSSYPLHQIQKFKEISATLQKNGINIPVMHMANSAATMLFPQTHFQMVRPGIAIYGLWPSDSTKNAMKKINKDFTLEPVLTWKTRIAQIKEIPKNSYVGYGFKHKTAKKTRLAILPVGYYDGYDRGFSNAAHVLIHGKKAKVIGRVCMNIIMVDATNIPEAHVEDEVILLGRSGKLEVSADYLAELTGTINYEITTRINERIPRIVV